MAKFNINTFDPIYPEGNDKKGEIQLRRIKRSFDVDQNWTEEMRLDFLPVFSTSPASNQTLVSTPWGRQTMYRIVKYDNWDLPWVAPSGSPNFLFPEAPATDNINFPDIIQDLTNAYETRINEYIASYSLTDSIRINKVHVIGTNIQYFERAGEHLFFQTFDVIFYGQQSPNPAIPPTPPPPPCDPYTNVFTVRFNNTPQNVTPTVGLSGEMYATLISDQQQFAPIMAAQWGYNLLNITSFPTIGATYAVKVNADPMPPGTTVDLQIRFGTIATAPVLNITLTDAGIVNQFFPITCNPNSFGNHKGFFTVYSSNQTPIAPTTGRNYSVNLSFQLYTETCLIPT